MSLMSTHVTHADRTTFPDIQLIRPRDYAPGGPREAQCSELRAQRWARPRESGGRRGEGQTGIHDRDTHRDTHREREREREREGTRDRMALGVGAWTMERESATEEANGSSREENGGEEGRGSTQGSFHGQPSQGPRLRFDVMLRKAREHQGTKGRELQDESRPRVPVRYMVRPL